MSKHGQPMSQTLAQMHLNELKMNDPKSNKIFQYSNMNYYHQKHAMFE